MSEEGTAREFKANLVIVIDHKNAAFRVNVSNIAETLHKRYHLIVWDSTGGHGKSSLPGVGSEESILLQETSFLNSPVAALKNLPPGEKTNAVLLVDSSVAVTEQDIEILLNKFIEYQTDVILCTNGIRLFPHVRKKNTKFRDGNNIMWRFYDSESTERCVHLMCLSGGVCLFRADILTALLSCAIKRNTTSLRLAATSFSAWPEFFMSMMTDIDLAVSIWKVQHKMTMFSKIDVVSKLESETQGFYKCIREMQWPADIWLGASSESSYAMEESSKRTPRTIDDLWTNGFGGFNASADSMPLDFAACKSYGASVVRLGAVNDASDLKFLVFDDDDADWGQMFQHIDAQIGNLRRSIVAAVNAGLSVILTFCDAPCVRFKDPNDNRLWVSKKNRLKFAAFWKFIASHLIDMRSAIAGYDLLNEPCLPGDITKSFYCDIEPDDQDKLYELYCLTVSAIREVDKNVKIIVESSYWASPRTFEHFIPLNDPNVVYSFHFYTPHLYTNREENKGRYEYPGKTPKWKAMENVYRDCWPCWNRDTLEEMIKPVVSWQHRHNISPRSIFVGEFGVCREVAGAEKYLTDLVNMWLAHGWSWCLFSFRDNEWDAMDYELGTDIDNQLVRKHTPLLNVVSKHMY